METLPIKFKRTVSQHIEHSVNPYYTTWDRNEGYKPSAYRVATGNYGYHEWASAFSPNAECVTALARESIARKGRRRIRDAERQLGAPPTQKQEASDNPDRSRVSDYSGGLGDADLGTSNLACSSLLRHDPFGQISPVGTPERLHVFGVKPRNTATLEEQSDKGR